jgi:hypothetical protein
MSIPQIGRVVLYHLKGQPARAAIVGNVHDDGRTVDLVILLDGDPRNEDTRRAWTMGHGVYRMRAAIPCAEDDPASCRHWSPLQSDETTALELVREFSRLASVLVPEVRAE